MASKTALHRGVEFFNEQPALPVPLRELLTDTCATCGHAALHWLDTIDTLEQRIMELDQQIAAHQQKLDVHLATA